MKKINFKEIVKLVEKTGKNIIDKFELWDYC